jgi:hypothetical protein
MLFGGAMARPIIEGIDADPEYSHRFIDTVVVPALGLT